MFNFKNGTALAIQQDQYIKLYKTGGKLTSSQISDMEQNVWVATAAKMAPSNLVIRQYALIDLFKGTANHRDKIFKQMDILSYKLPGEDRIWAEGYSYYVYTMDAVDLWISKFDFSYDLTAIKNIINWVRNGFVATSYLRVNKWYPAPFGDLRDIPLAQDLQYMHPPKTKRISNVVINYLGDQGKFWYSIDGKPIGLNTHIPKDSYTIEIVDGIPQNFKFYVGYDKKYKNSWEEYLDTYNIKRVRSIPL